MKAHNFELPKNLADHEAVINSSKHYLALIKLHDLTLPSHATEEKATPNHRRPSLKKKGGTPPADYNIAEMVVDFEQAITRAEQNPSKETVRALILFRLRLNRHCPV